MKKILFFAAMFAALTLAITACDPKKQNEPELQELKPADLIGTMWRTDSVFMDGEKSPGPHFIVDVFAADKALLNGDTVTYHFDSNHLIVESRNMDIEVAAFYGETAKLKDPEGVEMYVCKLPALDYENQIMEPKTADFVGTWKLAYYSMDAHTLEGAWYTMGTNPGVETWELRADGSATYHSTFTGETQNGAWSYEFGMQMVNNPAQSHLVDENDRITVQPLTKNWMGFVRGDGTTYYHWYFVRLK